MNQLSLAKTIYEPLVTVIASTNALSLDETLGLILQNHRLTKEQKKLFEEFKELLGLYQFRKKTIDQLLNHPVAKALEKFLLNFPLLYNEDHTHLTGSLGASFLLPFLQEELDGPNGKSILKELEKIYPDQFSTINKSKSDAIDESFLESLLVLAPEQYFDRYLSILYIPKVILTTRDRHAKAAFHMAENMFKQHVGRIRLKFTLSRDGQAQGEPQYLQQSKIDHTAHGKQQRDSISTEDVILGLYEGFKSFKKLHPSFQFILSPSFRKENDFYNNQKFSSKAQDIEHQVAILLNILERHPYLKEVVTEVDTVGDERNLYRKEHFNQLRRGLRKLKSRGFAIRSHHGEVWTTLRRGIQAVDNALNLWDIDTLEHGLSLGINPNSYLQRIYQESLLLNEQGIALEKHPSLCFEIEDLYWKNTDLSIKESLLKGKKLTSAEELIFSKSKFHTALDLEHYQHDVLNRLIQKKVSLVALPSSNQKLTSIVDDYLDHPFSWWEKKGIQLGIGTDNMITLSTNYIKEMLVILFTDPYYLKIMKLLMVATGETRRPYLSHLLWKMAHHHQVK